MGLARVEKSYLFSNSYFSVGLKLLITPTDLNARFENIKLFPEHRQ